MTPVARPDRYVSPGKKDKVYHLEYGRSCIAQIDHAALEDLRLQMYLNGQFFAGNQWILREDIETFLMNSSEDSRNRLAVKINMFRTVLEKYRGTALRMSFNCTARPIGGLAMNRMQEFLARQLNMGAIAATSTNLRDALSETNTFGRTDEETTAIIENTYRDQLLEALHQLILAVAEICEVGKHNEEDMWDLVNSGLVVSCAKKGYTHMELERVSPKDFFYGGTQDIKSLDLRECEFMGYHCEMSPTAIYEQYQPPDSVVRRIESAMRSNAGIGASGAVIQPTVYRVCWKDFMYQVWGYVRGIDGLPELAKINFIPPDAPPDFKPEFTDADVIDPEDTPRNWEFFRGGRTRQCIVEICRYVDMIPWESMFGCTDDYKKSNVPKEEQYDICLAYGVHDFQEVNPFDTAKVKLPFQVRAWAIHENRIIAPMSDHRDPQRFMNRIMSVTEQQFNNSGGKGVMIDTDMLPPHLDENDVTLRVRRGEAIPFETKGKGIPNAFGIYDATPGQGTHAYFQVLNEVMSLMRVVSATPEAATGTATADQLNGVTQMLLEQSNILDGAIYHALADYNRQKYQHIATAGKQLYLERPDVIKDLVSTQDQKVLLASEDAALERLLIKIERVDAEQVERKNVDSTAIALRNMGLLDGQRFANIFGRGTMDQLLSAIRSFASDLARAEAANARQNAMNAVTSQLAMREQGVREQSNLMDQAAIEAAGQAAEGNQRSKEINQRTGGQLAIEDRKARNELLVGAHDSLYGRDVAR